MWSSTLSVFVQRNRCLAVAAIFLIVLAIGCSKDSSPAPTPTAKPVIGAFSVTPATISAAGTVTLSWNVTDATSLTIDQGVGAVTPVTSGTKDVTASATTTYTLTATNSGGNTTATATVTFTTPTTITVNGIVKDIDGEPITAATVIVKGKSPVTTSSNGNFSVSSVSAPYEVSVILSAQLTAITYKGLTTSSPTLLYLSSLTSEKTATITGAVPALPAAPIKPTLVFFVSGTHAWQTTANQTTGAYTINATWKGSATTYSGTLYVLRWSLGTNNLPSTYDAFGQKTLTITASGTFPNNNFATGELNDPSDVAINGVINRPGTSTPYQLTNKQLFLNFGGGGANAFVFVAGEGGGGTLTDNFAYNVATITGATYEVDAYSQQSAAPGPGNRSNSYWDTGINAGSTSVTINLQAAPQLSVPAHLGTNIDTNTTFLWSAGGGSGVHQLMCAPVVAGSGRPTFFIFTTGTSTTIPNLASLGMGFPLNTQYQWIVTQYYPLSSVDAAAADAFRDLQNGNGGDFGRGISETFTFTTKP